jgi:D-beta-D-heptose 7-phosphate kinase/D-beta-D-heptose 1-phosphate adenosyltransferase
MILVFTNGCFDLLHAGHVELLRRARELGDRLIVGLNSDNSVRLLKGPGRPVVCEADRRAVLQAIRFVDEVIVFDEPTPDTLIREIRPDILVKGAEYRGTAIPGEAHAGKVVLIPMLPHRSTSALVRRLKSDCLPSIAGS